jgi:hypothetical protein
MTVTETTHEIANGHDTNGHDTNGHDTNGNGTIKDTSNGDNKKTRQRSQLQPGLEVAISPNDPNKIPSTIEFIQSLGKSYSSCSRKPANWYKPSRRHARP